MQTLIVRFVCATVLSTMAWSASAEKADSDKPTRIDAARGHYNDLKQTGWYEGDVVLTKGTLRLQGARMDFRKDPEGYEYAVVVAAKGQLATFRQRRDPTRPGVEEIVEGQAERIEYDGKVETIKLIQRASWRRLENEQPRDEIAGNQIVYDSRNATYRAAGDDTPDDGGGESNRNSSGRVRTIIAPRRDDSATPVPTPSGSLKRAESVK